jgi:UDP-glucose 4-epimerase
VKLITNREVGFVEADIRDAGKLGEVFGSFKPDGVVHFAGLKAVGESVENPLIYYDNNVTGSVNLLSAMSKYGCSKIVFSSSATVYGDPQYLPYDEAHPLNPVNPYGRTKLMVEGIIADWCAADSSRSAVALRYFNPVGAHVSGMIGEDPRGVPNNLMPFIAQVAVGRRESLKVFGGDYDTSDGIGARDYIHVVDLARAHVSAIEYIKHHLGFEANNVGTGSAVTVLELVKAFERASGCKVPYELVERRAGDVASSVADPRKAIDLMDWRAQNTVDDMCKDTWNWQSQNIAGFKSTDTK